MAQYPGAFRASVQYLLSSISSTLLAFIGIGIFSLPTLATAFTVGEDYATFALLAWVGWAVLIGQRTLGMDESNDFDNQPRKGKAVIEIFALAYFSFVTLVSLLLAVAVTGLGYPVLATGIAFLYPAYDIVMGEKSIPISVLGIVVLVATLINTLHSLTQVAAEGLKLPGRLARRGPGGMLG